MSYTKKKKQLNIPYKFKNVTAFTIHPNQNELMMVFNGFEDEEDLSEFADFVFSKINMRHYDKDKVPTIH